MDEENIQDLKKRIIARDNIIELFRKKYNDPFIENEIQKMQSNENQFLLLKDNLNPNKDNMIMELKLQIENLQKENDFYKQKLNIYENQANQYKFEMDNNNNKNRIYKEQMEQVLKQHCDNKLEEIYSKLIQLLNKKIDFFLKKHENQGTKIFANEQNNEKVKELQDFILNLKKEIDKKVNQMGPINNKNIYQSFSQIQNSNINNHQNEPINDSYLKEVSFECTNKSNLFLDVFEGTQKGEIEINLKNNGNKTWLDGRTKLVFERESRINGEDIILRPQRPGESGKYKIILKRLENLSPNQYKSNLSFYVGDNEVGQQIILTINIKKKLIQNDHYL